jgi:hypothetical protein
MPCNASYARFIFGKFFTSAIILYVLLVAQNFYSCEKWVLHNWIEPGEKDIFGPDIVVEAEATVCRI